MLAGWETGGDIAAVSAEWPVLLERAGDYFVERGAYSPAARPLRDALALRERTLGPEHPDTARSLYSIAVLLHWQWDLEGARLLHERALAIREKVPGPEHPDTAHSLYSVAVLLYSQGDLERARPLHERALAIREKVLGPKHPDTAQSLDGLLGKHYAKADHVQWWREQVKERGSLEAVYREVRKRQREYRDRDVG